MGQHKEAKIGQQEDKEGSEMVKQADKEAGNGHLHSTHAHSKFQ